MTCVEPLNGNVGPLRGKDKLSHTVCICNHVYDSLEIQGSELRVDKKVSLHLRAPLIHPTKVPEVVVG